MAKIDNPRKEFQFNVVIPGLNPFLCQKAKLPDLDYDIVEHGDTGHLIKTAGLVKLGKFSIDKIVPSDLIDGFIWNWARPIRDFRTGGGLLPSMYKRFVMVEQFGNDGLTVVQRWQLVGAWPSKINGIEFSRTSSENTVEAIEFEVDELLF